MWTGSSAQSKQEVDRYLPSLEKAMVNLILKQNRIKPDFGRTEPGYYQIWKGQVGKTAAQTWENTAGGSGHLVQRKSTYS